MTIRIALMGCGRIFQRHAELLASGSIQGASLVGVCDIDTLKAKMAGEKYKVPAFSSLQEMMKDIGDKIDVVSVLTPSGYHAEHTIEVAKYKKHVIVEKPMALTLTDADEMIRACDQNGVRLFVVKQNRFNVPVQKLKEAVDENRFGKLVLGTVRVRWCRDQKYYNQDNWRGTWALDGGVLANQASHHIDLLEWLMGEVESVSAKATTRLVDIETEDTAVAILQFKNGALGVIEATTATRPKDLEGSISILGEGGTVEIAGFAVNNMKTWNFINHKNGDEDVLVKYSVNPSDVYGFGHKVYYDHVVDCLKNGTRQLVDGLEGRKSLELLTAIYEAIENCSNVELRFNPKRCKLGIKS